MQQIERTGAELDWQTKTRPSRRGLHVIHLAAKGCLCHELGGCLERHSGQRGDGACDAAVSAHGEVGASESHELGDE